MYKFVLHGILRPHENKTRNGRIGRLKNVEVLSETVLWFKEVEIIRISSVPRSQGLEIQFKALNVGRN